MTPVGPRPRRHPPRLPLGRKGQSHDVGNLLFCRRTVQQAFRARVLLSRLPAGTMRIRSPATIGGVYRPTTGAAGRIYSVDRMAAVRLLLGFVQHTEERVEVKCVFPRAGEDGLCFLNLGFRVNLKFAHVKFRNLNSGAGVRKTRSWYHVYFQNILSSVCVGGGRGTQGFLGMRMGGSHVSTTWEPCIVGRFWTAPWASSSLCVSVSLSTHRQ